VEPGFVKMISPQLGPSQIIEVPEIGLAQYYRQGWRLLAPDEEPPVPPLDVPPPMSVAEVSAAAEPPAPAEPSAKKEK
jgi:hypothetical protein